VEGGEGTLLRSPKRRKALKGEAQERWELKEASKGCEARTPIERVAKPEGGTSGETGQSPPDISSKGFMLD